MATTTTITIYRGEAVDLNFTMSPVEDITGWTLAFTVAKTTGASTKLIGPVAGAVVSGPDGTFTVSLTTAQTDVLEGTYQYDVWRTDSGSERVLAIAPFTIAANVRLPA